MTASTRPSASAYGIVVRVYFEDTDVTGVVYHANYLRYFERARSDWLRDAGVGQEQLRQDAGACFAVADCTVHYHAPARLDDLLEVTVEVQQLKRASVVFSQQIRRGDALLASGTFRVASLNAQNFRPAALPESVRKAMEAAL